MFTTLKLAARRDQIFLAENNILATGQQVIHALKWNAIGRLSAQLVTWAITLLVMRMLTPADYGLMGLAMMMTGFFALFNDLGATPHSSKNGR